MGLPPVEAVIFDYGGVISQSPFRRLAEYERQLGLAPGALADLLGYGVQIPEPIDGEPYTNKWHLLEIGAIEMPEYVEWVRGRSAAVFGNPVDIGSRVGGGFDTMSIHWMVVHKVRDLRARGYQVAICTNNIAVFRPTWQQQFPLEWFDDVVDSSEVGVRKPDEAIYLLACERLGRSPQQCVFVDDHPGNIAGAEAVGMAGVLVGENPWEALDDLEAILTARAPTGAARTATGS